MMEMRPRSKMDLYSLSQKVKKSNYIQISEMEAVFTYLNYNTRRIKEISK